MRSGRGLSERWWMKERIREWDGRTQWRVREIIFSSLSLPACSCPSSILILLPWQQSSNQNISSGFHLGLSTVCPEAVCIHKLCDGTSQDPASTCHFNTQSHPAGSCHYLCSRCKSQADLRKTKLNKSPKTVFSSVWSIKTSREQSEWHINELTAGGNNSPESVARD